MRIYVDDPAILKEVCDKVLRLRPPVNVKRMLDSINDQIKDDAEKLTNVERMFNEVNEQLKNEAKQTTDEVESLDRIVSGLRPIPFPFPSKDEVPGALAEHIDYRPFPEIEWRKIPGFSKYTMNTTRKIVEYAIEEEVPVTLGRLNNVLLTGDDGKKKRMSVNHLFQQTFPEIAKPGL